jgi:hypothetical protein
MAANDGPHPQVSRHAALSAQARRSSPTTASEVPSSADGGIIRTGVGCRSPRRYLARSWPTDSENRWFSVVSGEPRPDRTERPFVQVIGLIG